MKIFYLLILALLAGCAQQPEIGDNNLIITAFSSGFDTKATETSFEAGDMIGLFLENNASNLRYETTDGSVWKGFGNVGQFAAGDKVTAYYPYSETAKNASAIEVSGGVDFMITSATPITVEGNKASAALTFRHVLGKLVVNADVAEINGVKTVSLDSVVVKNVFRKGSINLADGVISGLTDKGDLRGKGSEIIVIPQTVQKTELVFKMENGTFDRLAYNTPIVLESGEKTTFTARSNADLYFTSTLDLKNGDAQYNLPLSFYVAAGRSWTLTSSEAWLTISPNQGVGTGAPITVNVNVATNDIGTARKATLTLSDDNPPSVSYTVMQNYSKLDLSAYAPGETVPKAGKAYTITVTSNKNWSVTSTENVTVAPMSGFGPAAVKITVPVTALATTRAVSATFATANSTITKTWSGTQESDGPPSVDINGTKWLIANLGGTNPQDYGNFYKFGSPYVYDRVSGNIPAGHWGGYTTGSGSYPDGDPCKSLGAYKTPTHEQWQALIASGYSSWTTYQGINGLFFGPKATSLTVQDGSIFLPAAGYRDWQNGSFIRETTGGHYWSTLVYDTNCGWGLTFFSDGRLNPVYYHVHCNGFSVRCVAE